MLMEMQVRMGATERGADAKEREHERRGLDAEDSVVAWDIV